MDSAIMYIEAVEHGHRTKWARIGRVSLSRTGKTLYYGGRALQGMGRSWYRDAKSGEEYWIQAARRDGNDRHGKHKRGSYPIEIDDDVRHDYWTNIRHEPDRAQERVVHS
jgi:hypothetical protein